jgi:hypothetical protein
MLGSAMADQTYILNHSLLGEADLTEAARICTTPFDGRNEIFDLLYSPSHIQHVCSGVKRGGGPF